MLEFLIPQHAHLYAPQFCPLRGQWICLVQPMQPFDSAIPQVHHRQPAAVRRVHCRASLDFILPLRDPAERGYCLQGILSACEAAAIAADVLLAGTLTVTLWTQGYQRSRQSYVWLSVSSWRSLTFLHREFPTTDLFMTYVVKTGTFSPVTT